MGGIAGLYNLDGRPVTGADLERLASRLRHRGLDGDGTWVQGPVGLAALLSSVTPESAGEKGPLVHPRTGAVVVFDGRLDDREEFLAGRGGDLPSDASDPALILAAHALFGDAFLERLKGDFALALFDPLEERLVLARDRIGIRPLYYFRGRNFFVFASEVKAVLAEPRLETGPNDAELARLLLHEGGPGDPEATCFLGVRRILPAHMAIVTPGGFATRRFWDFDPSRRLCLASYPEYVEAFGQEFGRAVGRRMRSAHPAAVSVSGGLDSSSIFCLAETMRRRSPGRHPAVVGVSHVTADGSAADERTYLLEIENAYGLAIERVGIEGLLGLVEGAAEEIWHAETPLLDYMWEVTRAIHRTARNRGARVLVTGHWADQILFSTHYLIDLFHGLRWRELRTHLAEYGNWFTADEVRSLKRAFLRSALRHYVPGSLVPFLRVVRRSLARRANGSPWFTPAFRSRARTRRDPGPPGGPSFPSAHASSVYGEARSRYHVECMEWDNKIAALHGLEMAFPFLDADLVSFLMAVPGEVRTWKGVPKALLRESMRGVLPEPIRRRNWKADYTDPVNEGMVRDYPKLMEILGGTPLSVERGYVDPRVLRKSLVRLRGQIRGPECTNTWNVADLLGFELWLRTFFGRA
ncbi:MAG: hypothetical protein HY720_10815 [Planctomycetes bacterium]|nr:hypothetical protein [Planctomycetota bacterium]